MAVHGDGDMKMLLQSLRDCGIQAVEAFTPRPMTSIDVASTRRLWQDRVAMWGGVASTVLTDVYSDRNTSATWRTCSRRRAGRSFHPGLWR